MTLTDYNSSEAVPYESLPREAFEMFPVASRSLDLSGLILPEDFDYRLKNTFRTVQPSLGKYATRRFGGAIDALAKVHELTDKLPEHYDFAVTDVVIEPAKNGRTNVGLLTDEETTALLDQELSLAAVELGSSRSPSTFDMINITCDPYRARAEYVARTLEDAFSTSPDSRHLVLGPLVPEIKQWS